VKALEHASFRELAERIAARYNEEEDVLLLDMLGQEYMVRRNGIFLLGQKAPDVQSGLVLDYLCSGNAAPTLTPWRAIGEFRGRAARDFREKVEQPLSNYATEIVNRANALMPMIGGSNAASFIGSDMAITVRALPKVYLHMELSQETQDFPAEAWLLFSNNAGKFLAAANLQMLAEAFKDRLLSLLRIY
jgi:Domain of unknown function (DUF3786)